MKKLLLILLCLPFIGFGQKSGIIGWNGDYFAYKNIIEDGMIGTIEIITIKDPRNNEIIAKIHSEEDMNYSPDLVKKLLLRYGIIEKEYILINNRVDDIMHLDCLKNLIKKENNDFQIIGYHYQTTENRSKKFLVKNEEKLEKYVIINVEKRYLQSGGPDIMGNPIYIYYNDYYACKL